MQGFIYQWTNHINGRKYIGSHRGSVTDNYTGSGLAFKRAVAKHGIENFSRIILEETDNILQREQYYLDLYQCASSPDYYNIKPIAGGGFELYNIPENLTRQRERLRSIQHLSSRFAGKNHSPETKIRIRDSVKKTLLERGLCRAVDQYSIDGEYITTFNSITAAAQNVNTSPSNIQLSCEGKRGVIKGYKWKYSEGCTL